MTDRSVPALRRPRAILFDWDNTLVDNWAVIHTALNAALTAMGHAAWTLAETKQRVRASARDSFPVLFGDRWEKAQAIFYDTFRRAHIEQLREMPGAGAMLAELARAGIYLGVVSNKQGPFLRREAEHLGWTGRFGRIVGATDAPRDKPAVEPVEMALDGSGVGRGPEVWFVGDTDIDLVCAVNAGCVPILLRQEPPAPGEFPDAPPARHLQACQELAELVAEI